MEDSPQATRLLQQGSSQVASEACQRQHNTNGRLKAWSLEDLPKGCNTNDTFKLIVSPTYLQMLGHNRKPFGIPDKEDLLSMQAIFNHVYQSLQEYTIKIGPNCPVYGMVCHYYPCVYSIFNHLFSSIQEAVIFAIFLHLPAAQLLTPFLK